MEEQRSQLRSCGGSNIMSNVQVFLLNVVKRINHNSRKSHPMRVHCEEDRGTTFIV